MPPEASVRQFMSVDEFVERTGLSSATIRRRIRGGSLPVFQPGGPRSRILIPIDALRSVGLPDRPLIPKPVVPPVAAVRAMIPGPSPRWTKFPR